MQGCGCTLTYFPQRRFLPHGYKDAAFAAFFIYFFLSGKCRPWLRSLSLGAAGGAERCLLGACQEKEQNAVRSRLTGKQRERSRKHSDSQSQSRTLGQRCSGAVVQVKQGSGGGGGGGRRCRLDTQELSVLTSLIYSVVMVLLLISIAPSATIMIFSLFIPARFYRGWGGWWRENMTEKLRLSEAWQTRPGRTPSW